MNTHQSRSIDLPLKGNIALIYIFSSLIAILMAVVSIAGLQYRTFIYPAEESIQAFVPNDSDSP